MQRTQERTWAPLAALLALAVALLVALSPAAAWAENEETTYVATVTTSDGTTTSYTDLSTAISAATSESTVTLLSDVTLTYTYFTISASTSLTIDLDDYTLTFDNDDNKSTESSGGYYLTCFQVYGSLTLKNGTVQSANLQGITAARGTSRVIDVFAGGSLTTESLTIQCYTDAAKSYSTYAIQVNPTYGSEDVSVTMTSTTISERGSNGGVLCGVVIFGATDNSGAQSDSSSVSNTVTVSITGSTITTSGYAVTGNGAHHGVALTITDSTLTSTGSTAIYNPQYGITTITNSTITGYDAGIEVRAGTVSISDSTVICTTTATATAGANGNGTTVTGVGIGVSQHTTNLPISVTIEDCTVSGACAVYETDVQDDDTGNVTMSIDGGTYTSTGTMTVTGSDGATTTSTSAIAVYSEDVTSFIMSGTFLSAATDGDGAVTINGSDVDLSYVVSSAVVVYVDTTDTTYVGTLAEVNEILEEVTTSSSTVTVLSTGGADSADFTVADQATVVNATTDSTVTVNDESVTIAAGATAESHIIESIAKAATCASTGYADDAYQCTVCGQYFTGSTDDDGVTTYTKVSESDVLLAIDADAHDWDYDEDDISVVWADGYSSVTVTWTCLNDASHTYTDTTSKVYSATGEDGTTTYLAYLTDPDGGSYTVTVDVEAEEEATTADSTTSSSDSDGETLASTGDSTALAFGSIAGMGALALAAGLAARRRRNAA